MATDPAADLSAEDIDALKRALKLMQEAGEAERAHYDAIHKESGWREAAIRAAYSAQVKSLDLRPWQAVPFEAADEIDEAGGYGKTEAEVGLRQRLLAAGLSLYEPDPIEALTRADRPDVA
jgi:hypothetical protein